MAETAVTLLFDKLQQLLHAEATIFIGVHDEVSRIQNQLKLINSFLKDADIQAEEENTTNVVKEWVNQMREVAYCMEDVIDRYLLKVVERGQRHGFLGAVTKSKEKLKTVTHRHEIASQITKITKSIEELNKARESLNLNSSAAESRSQHHRLGGHFVEESQLVGINHVRKVLTDWLTRRESKRSLMVVVGEGGIGKTTIVKNVYNKQKKIKSFEFYVWITVSRPQDDDMLFRAIIENIHEEHPNVSAGSEIKTTNRLSLINKVREYLQDKKYLIVFDDVWEPKFWHVVQDAIEDSNKTSRVIITTRDARVADCCISEGALVDVHKVEPLSQNDALELFHRKAFRFEPEGCPQELKTLSKDIVKKCCGMPLAIEAIAGLLSTKKTTVSEWQNVHDRLGSVLLARDESVQQVMSKSYHDLPSHLKLCFLYFGLFPEDYSISCMRLIRLWVAEGFVNENEAEDTSMEEVAEGYLAELFRRCLVQVSRVDFDGKPKSCRVHDLMHKYILRKCKEQNFCQVMKDNAQVHPGRRLSLHTNNNENFAMKSAANWGRVRSCFVFNAKKYWPVKKSFFSSFELLIGLDLCDARLHHLPEEVGKLLNLKYLSLRNSNITSLPRSIGKLENLQTLDLKRTRVHELPEEIKMLIKLRHLLAYYINNEHFGLDSLQGVKLKEGLENLTSLQKLSFLDATHAASIIALKQLVQLRKLGIIKLERQYGKALCSAIESMTHLRSLSIGAIESHEILELQSLRDPPQYLQRLYLYGRLERFPSWIPKLRNLVRLYLKWSGLKDDPLSYLKDLSELLQLELYDTYGGDELHFKNGWLKGLKVLYLESMPKLKSIKIDKGALPRLGELKIGRCHEMMRVPSDVQNLISLKTLNLYDMPDQMISRITGPHGEDLRIVNKIPLVLYSKDDHFDTLNNLDSLNDEFEDENNDMPVYQ